MLTEILCGLTAIAAIAGLWFVHWSIKGAKSYDLQFYECWYYDALGCRIELGLFVADGNEPRENLDRRIGEKVGPSFKYYYEIAEI